MMIDNRGSVTLLMVFMTSVIIAVGLGFNWLVREHLLASESLRNKADAIVTAHSASDALLYLLVAGRREPQQITFAGGEITSLPAVPLDGSLISLFDDVTVQVWDSNGRFSLTKINQWPMMRYMEQKLGVQDGSYLVGALYDWTDRDDITRRNGAEARAYKKFGGGQPIPNRPLQYMEELAFIRGYSLPIAQQIEDDVTLLPTTGFNPNTASVAMLRALLQLDDSTLKKVIDYRQRTGELTEASVEALIGHRVARKRFEAEHTYSPSGYVDVTISVGEPRRMYSIREGVCLDQKSSAPFSILYWREE